MNWRRALIVSSMCIALSLLVTIGLFGGPSGVPGHEIVFAFVAGLSCLFSVIFGLLLAPLKLLGKPKYDYVIQAVLGYILAFGVVTYLT